MIEYPRHRSLRRQALALALKELGLEGQKVKQLSVAEFHLRSDFGIRAGLQWICCEVDQGESVGYQLVYLKHKTYRDGQTRYCMDLWIGQCESCGVVMYVSRPYTVRLYPMFPEQA